MRQSKIKNLFGDSGYKSPFLSYTLLYLLALLELLVLWKNHAPGGFDIFPDTPSYFEASETILHGEIHYLRTPVYPLIIAIVRSIVGENLVVGGLAFLQSLLFLVSVYYVSRIALIVSGSKRTAFWATAFYALSPWINCQCVVILTESLTCSFTVFFIWGLLRHAHEVPRISDAILSGLWLIMLIFLRPAMLCLLPAYIIFWSYMAFKYRRISMRPALTALGMLILCGASLLIYKQQMTRKYGLHSLTCVTICNNYFALREIKALRENHTSNPALKEALRRYQDSSPRYMHGTVNIEEYHDVVTRINADFPELERAERNAMSERPTWFISTALEHVKIAGFQKLVYLPVQIDIQILWYFLFIILSGVWLAWRRKGIMLWSLWLIFSAETATSLIGAMDDWSRLILPGVPAAIIFAATALQGPIRAWQTGREVLRQRGACGENRT